MLCLPITTFASMQSDLRTLIQPSTQFFSIGSYLHKQANDQDVKDPKEHVSEKKYKPKINKECKNYVVSLKCCQTKIFASESRLESEKTMIHYNFYNKHGIEFFVLFQVSQNSSPSQLAYAFDRLFKSRKTYPDVIHLYSHQIKNFSLPHNALTNLFYDKREFAFKPVFASQMIQQNIQHIDLMTSYQNLLGPFIYFEPSLKNFVSLDSGVMTSYVNPNTSTNELFEKVLNEKHWDIKELQVYLHHLHDL